MAKFMATWDMDSHVCVISDGVTDWKREFSADTREELQEGLRKENFYVVQGFFPNGDGKLIAEVASGLF